MVTPVMSFIWLLKSQKCLKLGQFSASWLHFDSDLFTLRPLAPGGEWQFSGSRRPLVWNAGNSPGRNITSSNGNISVQCLESIHRTFDIMDSASPTLLGLFFSLAAIVKGCLPLPVAQCRRFPACQRWCSQCLLRTFFDSVKSILLCYISICHRTSLGQLH